MNWADYFQLLRTAVADRELPSVAQIGHDSQSPFRILISTLVSLRTKDSVTWNVSMRLFAIAPTPQLMLQLNEEQLAAIIYPAGFYRQKAQQIRAICQKLVDDFAGKVPSDLQTLLSFPGVGLKTANLTLGLGFGIPAICVDTHVHRVCNRLGWINTSNADKSEAQLRQILPQEYWIELNDLLVKFGQDTCTPTSPFCYSCPLADFCPQIGVTRRRKK